MVDKIKKGDTLRIYIPPYKSIRSKPLTVIVKYVRKVCWYDYIAAPIFSNFFTNRIIRTKTTLSEKRVKERKK